MSINSQTDIANRHDFEATVSKTFNSNQSQTVFLAPVSNQRLKCTGGAVSTAATSGRIYIYYRDSGVVVGDLTPTASQTYFIIPKTLFIGREDDPLMITTTTGSNNVFISLNVSEGEYQLEVGTTTSTTTSTSSTTSTTAT